MKNAALRLLALAVAGTLVTACAAGLPDDAREPPPPLPEMPSSAPAPGMVWVAGAWHWNGVDHVWVPGHWMSPPPTP